MLSKFRKFTMEFFGKITVGLVGLFWCGECSYTLGLPANGNLGKPSTSFLYARNAFKSGGIRLPDSLILTVLRGCGFTKIFPFVIHLIIVDMVNLIFRPFTCLVQPSNSIGHVLGSKNTNNPAEFTFGFSFVSGPVANFHIGRIGCFPLKKSGLWIIVKNLTDFIGREIIAKFRFIGYSIISHLLSLPCSGWLGVGRRSIRFPAPSLSHNLVIFANGWT
jgi:hypothetical protein